MKRIMRQIILDRFIKSMPKVRKYRVEKKCEKVKISPEKMVSRPKPKREMEVMGRDSRNNAKKRQIAIAIAARQTPKGNHIGVIIQNQVFFICRYQRSQRDFLLSFFAF